MSKKIKLTLALITLFVIGISIFINKVLLGYGEVTINKTEEIMNQQQKWVDDIITASDTTSYATKKRIDSLTKVELKRLKTQDSLLKLELEK